MEKKSVKNLYQILSVIRLLKHIASEHIIGLILLKYFAKF